MERIDSPADNTSDSAIEREIQRKGLTAPRITPADLDANITGIEYIKHISLSGQVLRWAVLNTRCGFAVTGNPSVSVSPENDRQDIGETVALANAKNALWPLMGYALKERLAASPTTTRVYSDGTSVTGTPPFPALSPAQQDALNGQPAA